MWEDLFLKDFKQYQVSSRPDPIEISAFKLQLAWNTLERMCSRPGQRVEPELRWFKPGSAAQMLNWGNRC